MRLDPLSALRHLEALDDQQLCALADRIADVQWRRRQVGTVTKIAEYDGGRQIAWRCDPPVADYDGSTHEFVVSSYGMSRPECYVFPADKDGKITSYGELPPSRIGEMTHEQIWREAGYEVTS